MPKIESLDDPTNLAGRIAAAIAQPFLIDNALTEIGVGVGIAIAPNDGTDADELVRRADRALCSAAMAVLTAANGDVTGGRCSTAKNCLLSLPFIGDDQT